MVEWESLEYVHVCVCMNGFGSLKIYRHFVETLTLKPPFGSTQTNLPCPFSHSYSHAFLISHTLHRVCGKRRVLFCASTITLGLCFISHLKGPLLCTIFLLCVWCLFPWDFMCDRVWEINLRPWLGFSWLIKFIES